MDTNGFSRWVYPPSRENWWFWSALAFAGMFGLLLLLARVMPISSPAPVVIERVVAPPTPKPGQGVAPNGKIVDKPVGL